VLKKIKFTLRGDGYRLAQMINFFILNTVEESV